MGNLQPPKLPMKAYYLLPSIGISTLLYLNIYLHRKAEFLSSEYATMVTFLIILGMFLPPTFENIQIRDDAAKILNGALVLPKKSDTYKGIVYTVTLQVVAITLIIYQAFPDFQTTLDVLFFSFITIEFYRGFNARFQTKLLLRLVNEVIEEASEENKQS